MLAGLVHDVGAIPVLVRAERVSDLLSNERLLAPLVYALHAETGAAMLAAWRFPPELASAALEHENIERRHAAEPDYADAVIAANVLCRLGSKHPHGQTQLDAVPAVRKFGLSTEDLADIGAEARRRGAVLLRL
jgi:HD-like signal output (HDOD) protein